MPAGRCTMGTWFRMPGSGPIIFGGSTFQRSKVFTPGHLRRVAPAFGGIAEEAAAAAEAAREENGSFQTAELEKRLAAYGVECRSFACAGKLYKLRMAANAIKHGAGPSASELAKLRPDLFLNPVLSRLGWAKKGDDAKSPLAAVLASWFVAPLAGDNLYASERDLSKWCAAVMAYWKELSAILDGTARAAAFIVIGEGICLKRKPC